MSASAKLLKDPAAQAAIQAFCDSEAGQLAFAAVREQLATPFGFPVVRGATMSEAAQFEFYQIVGINQALAAIQRLGTRAQEEARLRREHDEKASGKVQDDRAWIGRRQEGDTP